jgi:hypothetical protein
MAQFSKTTSIYLDKDALRKRESTLFHLDRGWIPQDPDSLRSIHEKHENGEYLQSPEILINDLKKDLTLYLRAVTNLKPRLDSADSTINPMRDLKELPAAEIIELLPKSPGAYSKYRLEKGTQSQLNTLACSLLSSTATETFASQAESTGKDISVDDALSVSLMKQLGLNLLSWNYSTLFFKILKNYKDKPELLDKALIQNFGFTPETLAEDYARKWNLSFNIRSSLRVPSLYHRTNSLYEVCEFGDLFGKSNHPTIFPNAKKEWDERTDQLKDLIGTDNTAEIKERIEMSLQDRLRDLLPSQQKTLNATFKVVRPSQPKSYYFSQPILKSLPEEIVKHYVPVFEKLSASENKLPALKELTQNAIPASGFKTGVIYIEDSDGDQLSIKIDIGALTEMLMDSVDSSKLNQTAFEARFSNIPQLTTEKSGASVSGSFSSPSHRGVLVLEIDRTSAEEDVVGRDNILLFKAARECLESCLG